MTHILRRVMLGWTVALTSVVSFGTELDLTENNIPMVLTPTRLRQSLADVPASVTVITAEMLQRFGITSVPDALRLVPGMALHAVTGNDFRINYHGTNSQWPRRMNVLIDGMSVYRPALARVDWKELPVVIEDIERIEVTRGSNSASYGANSMLAIVNIITKHPREAEGVAVAATVGSLNTSEGMVRYGGKLTPSTAYRMTVARQLDGGYDDASAFGQGHDSTRLNRLNFRSTTEIAANETFDWQLAIVDGVKENEWIDRYQRTFPDIDTQDYYLNTLWRKDLSAHHELQVQAYVSKHRVDQAWTTCVPTAMLLPQMFNLWRANPSDATALLSGRVPSGGTAQENALAAAVLVAMRGLGARATAPTCVDANQDYTESRKDIELQDTLVFSNALRMVAGIGARQDSGESQTLLGGRVANTSYRAFSNVEHKPFQWMNINAGGFWETDQLTGSAFSPRVAINTHLNANHTLRFVLSKGTRVPDIMEQRTNWAYLATNFNPPLNGATQGYFFQSARAPGNLNNENLLSREISYFGNLPQYGMLIDVKAFHDTLTELISEKTQLSSFVPTNRNSVRLRGAEVQLNYEPTDRLMLYLAYAYLDNDRASTPFEQTQYSRHSGTIGLSRLFANGWRCSFAYYGAAGSGVSQSHYGREDLTLSKALSIGRDSRLTASLTVRHLDNRSSLYFRDLGRVDESRYNSSMQYYLTFKLAL